jgi:hypothetical protein
VLSPCRDGWRNGGETDFLSDIYEVHLGLCSMTTLLDHKTTLAYLAYLGYPDEPRTSALQVTRARKIDRRKGKVTRNVFLSYVCGAAGSGKTSLLRAFAGKPFTPLYEPTSKMTSVVNAVDIDGSEKYLVVRTSRDGLFRLLISTLLLVSLLFLVSLPSFTLRPV